jgi:hypothetical protein
MKFCEKTGKSCVAVYMPLALSHHPPKDPEDHIAPLFDGKVIDFAKVPGKGVSKHDRSGRPPKLSPGGGEDSWPRISSYGTELFTEGGLYGKLGYLKGEEYSKDGWHLDEFPSMKKGYYPPKLKTLPGWMQFQEPQKKTENSETDSPVEAAKIVEGVSLRITESQLRRIIREVLITEAQKRSPLSRFLRFGDPRKVEGGVSVIHDPYAYAYSEEPALFAFEPGESPPSLKSEKGISAYSVVSESPEKIIFKIGVGLGTFQGQLGGFLWKRMIKEDIWIFSGRQIPGAFGADDEPLVDSKTVKNVKQVGLRNLWVIDDYSKSEKKLSDVVDSRDLASSHDMGYDEFLGKGVSKKEIDEYIASLKSKFTTKDQIEAIEEIEGFWNAQWEEDHPERETI